VGRLSPDLIGNGDKIYVLGRKGKIYFSSVEKRLYSKRVCSCNGGIVSLSRWVSLRREILKAGFSLSEAVGEYEAHRITKTEVYIQIKER